MILFLPTPSRRGRLGFFFAFVPFFFLFLPTPSRRGRQRTASRCFGGLNFYPRPRVEGDLRTDIYPGEGKDFYPRPRVEGDHDPSPRARPGEISTHALTWRATVDTIL